MEEKKVLKISLLTFFLILAIILIIVMGVFIFKLYNEKTEEIKKSSELQTQVDSLTGTVNDLQGKINNISETINSNNTTENNTTTDTNNNNNISFTDEQIKTALSNYLQLRSHLNINELLSKLTVNGDLNYNQSKETDLNNGKYITNIKYSDYKNAMLKYVSINEFERNWNSYYSVDNNGYLISGDGGGGLRVYTINSITKIDDSTYSAKTTATLVDADNSKEDENYTFSITSYNGNCVIDSIK